MNTATTTPAARPVRINNYLAAVDGVVFSFNSSNGHVGRIYHALDQNSAWDLADDFVAAGILRRECYGPATYGHVSYFLVDIPAAPEGMEGDIATFCSTALTRANKEGLSAAWIVARAKEAMDIFGPLYGRRDVATWIQRRLGLTF